MCSDSPITRRSIDSPICSGKRDMCTPLCAGSRSTVHSSLRRVEPLLAAVRDADDALDARHPGARQRDAHARGGGLHVVPQHDVIAGGPAHAPDRTRVPVGSSTATCDDRRRDQSPVSALRRRTRARSSSTSTRTCARTSPASRRAAPCCPTSSAPRSARFAPGAPRASSAAAALGVRPSAVERIYDALAALAAKPTAARGGGVRELFREGDVRGRIDPLRDRLSAEPPAARASASIPELHEHLPALGLPRRGQVRDGAHERVRAAGGRRPASASIGRHEEFTLYAAVALATVSDDPLGEWLALLPHVTGWGRTELAELILREPRSRRCASSSCAAASATATPWCSRPAAGSISSSHARAWTTRCSRGARDRRRARRDLRLRL